MCEIVLLGVAGLHNSGVAGVVVVLAVTDFVLALFALGVLKPSELVDVGSAETVLSGANSMSKRLLT